MSEKRPTRAQLDFLQTVYRCVAAVGSTLGSESSDAGLVIPTAAADLDDAIAHVAPASYVVHPLSFADFVARYGTTSEPGAQGALDALMNEIRTARPTAAHVGTAKDFHPEASSRGEFFVALFVRAKTRAGSNLLLLFPRVET